MRLLEWILLMTTTPGLSRFRTWRSQGTIRGSSSSTATSLTLGRATASVAARRCCGAALRSATACITLPPKQASEAVGGRSFSIYADNNVLATQLLMEDCKGAGTGIKKLIYASSSTVYGDSPQLPLREDGPCAPLSPYGVTKLAGEHLCALYLRNHDVPTVALRFFTVFGPRQRPDMAFHRFIRAGLDGEDIIVFGDG